MGLGAISRMVLMGKVKTTIGTKVMKIVNLEGDRISGRRRGMKGPDCLPVHMKYVGDALVARAPNDGLGASARSVHTYPAHAP